MHRHPHAGRNAPRHCLNGDSASHRTEFNSAFTLLELMIVLAIIGILAALALPNIKALTRSNVMVAANQQLLDDIAFARQRAINSRSPVYLLFMPPVNPDQTIYDNFLSTTQEMQMLPLQYTAYALFAERTVGDQPGRPFAKYLTPWKTLPNGVFIATNKFFTNYSLTIDGAIKDVLAFDSGPFPYPTSDTINPSPLSFPYIKFDEQGRLASRKSINDGTCIIPLARGSIFLDRDPATGGLTWSPASPRETGGNNSQDTNTYNHIVIDALTGRARLERRTL